MKTATLSRCSELIGKGVAEAMDGLSRMIGEEITVRSFGLKRISIAEMPELLGGPDVEVVGIYVPSSGSAKSDILLTCGPRTARAFVDLLMGRRRGTTRSFGEMERSALEEMANVVGSLFLNAVADEAGLYLRPSPPSLVIDMAGAVLDVVAANAALTRDEAFVAETTFHVASRDVSGLFFIVPSEDLLTTLQEGDAE